MQLHLIKSVVVIATLLMFILLLSACFGNQDPPPAAQSNNFSGPNSSLPPQALRSYVSGWNTDWDQYSIDLGDIISGGVPRDGIPAIDHPQFVSAAEAESWLAESEPVIAVEIKGEARAYPLQILMWHELVNDQIGNVPVLVSFCPLCNAVVVFDRRIDQQIFEFGVTGLLRFSDMIMYDRTTDSLWQQFTGEAIVGELTGQNLPILPSNIISFAEFRAAHRDGLILSQDTGYNRNYGSNPYVGYDHIDASPFLFKDPLDHRLRPMERVITVSLPGIEAAYPLSTLEETGIIEDVLGVQKIVVFHTTGTNSALDSRRIADGKDVGSTGVFDPVLDGDTLTFHRDQNIIYDHQTNSSWNILGHATAGRLEGKRLTPIVHANHFWFAWVAFQPDTILYSPEG